MVQDVDDAGRPAMRIKRSYGKIKVYGCQESLNFHVYVVAPRITPKIEDAAESYAHPNRERFTQAKEFKETARIWHILPPSRSRQYGGREMGTFSSELKYATLSSCSSSTDSWNDDAPVRNFSVAQQQLQMQPMAVASPALLPPPHLQHTYHQQPQYDQPQQGEADADSKKKRRTKKATQAYGSDQVSTSRIIRRGDSDESYITFQDTDGSFQVCWITDPVTRHCAS